LEFRATDTETAPRRGQRVRQYPRDAREQHASENERECRANENAKTLQDQTKHDETSEFVFIKGPAPLMNTRSLRSRPG
jgi:hypothetical protein